MQIPILDPARMATRRQIELYPNSSITSPRLPRPQPTNFILSSESTNESSFRRSRSAGAPSGNSPHDPVFQGDVRYVSSSLMTGLGLIAMIPYHHLFGPAAAAGAAILSTLFLGRRFGLMAGLVSVLGGAVIAGGGFIVTAPMALAVVFATDALATNHMFKSLIRSFFSGIFLGLLSTIALALAMAFQDSAFVISHHLNYFLSASGHEILSLAVVSDSLPFSEQIIIICLLFPALIRLMPSTWTTDLRFRALRPPWEYRR